jgi:thymidylate synthase (FAD)
MQIRLLAVTPEPEKLASIAAHGCYSEKSASELLTTMEPERYLRVLRQVVNSGHHSVIEHAYFTFSLEGISRACTHQLVRHRIASYSQQSQRYVEFGTFEPIIPPTIADDADARETFEKMFSQLEASYHQLIERGIPAEDARFILPNAMPTNIVVTMNARELNHFFTLRTCTRAQWEIREVALKMLEVASEVAPIFFENAGPPCSRGPCPEGKLSCGKPWREKKKGTIRSSSQH